MTNSNDVLGFNPISDTIKVSQVDITPEIAEYILKYHNYDNRKISKSQVANIAKSIRDYGWLQDGQPFTFNTDGNITEAQHRLLAIIETGITARVVLTRGVMTDCFTKTASAKSRRPKDEIQRKDKSATDVEVTALRQLLKRRQGETLTMQNAIEMWNIWKKYIRLGINLSKDFTKNTSDFKGYERVFNAWASLCIFMGYEDVASKLLLYLKNNLLKKPSNCITIELLAYWKEHSWNRTSSGNCELMYQLLCVATDRLLKKPDGDIQLGVTPDRMNHTYLKNQGVYRKFLDDADQIGDQPYFKPGFDPDN